VREDVIGFEVSRVDSATADVAPTCGFREDLLAGLRVQGFPAPEGLVSRNLARSTVSA
jgi:hypothetical protein